MVLDLNTQKDRRQAYRDLYWGDHGFLRWGFHNHSALGEGMYRENQPSPRRIARWKEMGITTVINLRGQSPKGFYLLEKEACAQHGLMLVNYRVYSRDVHSVEAIKGARDLFQGISYPAVMHCKSGSDRTGFMGTLYQYFHLNVPIAKARRQLSLRYLHIKQGKTGLLDFFFDEYERYNQTNPIEFMDWVELVYEPDTVKAKFMARRKNLM